MKRTFVSSHAQKPSKLGLCHGEKMSVVKPTSKICALLFCAMLWFSPAGAQQKTKVMPMPENSGTELKMDKNVSAMQRMEVASESLPMVRTSTLFHAMDFRVVDKTKNLSEDQKKEMVKSYMKEALHRPMRVGAKDGAQTVPSVFMGAGEYRTIRFEVDANKVKNVSYIANNMQTTVGYMYPGWGTWCEDHFEGWWYSCDEEAGKIYNVGYFSYDPVSDDVKSYTMEMTDPVRLSSLAAYDPIGKQIYTIRNVYSGGVLESIKVFKGSPKTAQFTEVGTINANWTPVAMAIDQTGKMYVIGTDANLYTIDKTTLQATEIGATGIATDAYDQSAAIDYRTQTLYWAYVNAAGTEAGVATVNTTTGEATKINNRFMQFTCLSSVYYTNPSPAEVEDFELSYNSDEQKVTASFTVPSLDVNGDALNAAALDTVEIFMVGSASLERVYAKQNPVPGEQLTAEIDATGKSGKLIYAIRVKNKANKYSEFAIENVIALNITLPYEYGFEDAESDLSVTVNASPASAAVRDNTEHHTGSYSMKFTSAFGAQMDMNMLNVEGIPVRKGATYKVSLYAKAAAEFAALFTLFDMNSETLDIAYVMNDWDEVTATYVAPAKGKMKFTMLGYDGTPIYIDDIKIEEILGSEVPASLEVNSITAAADGSNKAIVNITLPSETMGGETLSKIDSIILYLATNSQFPANLTTSVVIKENLTPGTTADFTVALPKAGNYYLVADIYNEVGACPYISGYFSASGDEYQKSPWIGSDMPTSVNVTAAPQTDGTVALTWSAPVAPHEGYIGTVTYTVKDAAGTQLYNGTDLTFTTAALALGMHTFTFEMTNGIETKTRKVNTIAGIQDGMIYSNVAASGTYEGRVLNVSATATNSAFSQMLYPATNQAMYIDTLLLFATAPETGEAKQYTKIYMGTTQDTAFGGSTMSPARDFVEKDKLTEVFADTLRFKAGENMLKLPLKGFYYNGAQTLVIGVVKPMQEPTTFAAAAYVAVSENNMLKYRSTSTEIDFDTVKSYNDYTGNINGYAVSMVAAPGADLKTLKVTVDSMGVTPLEGAIVTIVNKGGKNMKATINTGADGTVSFAYMPQGVYTVKAQKAAYIASEKEVTVGENSPVEVSFSLVKAKEVKVSGTVQDKGGNKLADVAVKAAGLADFTATTNADGEFELQGVYGPGEYTLLFEKAGMKVLSVPFDLGEKDTTLADPFEMGYQIMGVPMASVAVEDGNAVINWNKPSASTMLSWVSSFTQVRRLTIDNETPFKYAQRFLPEDLAALKLGNNTKALRFGFVPGSETAQYSIVLAADTTHEIYRAEVPADKLRVGQWCNMDIPAESAAIDVTKELWLIVEVSGEDQDYPCAATTTGTVDGKGNLMTYKNKWYPITEMFTNGEGNVLIRLLVEDATTQVESANGYRVYRGLLQDDFEDYTLLTQQTVKTTTYTDADYFTLPFGQYNYAIVSDWYGDDLSEPTYTNTLNKDMEFTVIFKVTSNAGSAKGAVVYMVDTALTRDYEAVVNDKDTAVIAKKVWRDVYDYEITLPYHHTLEGTLNLTQDTVVNVALEEIVLNPELTAGVEGKNVVINYGVNLHNWFDDVESYEDFAISGVDPWIFSPGSLKYGVQNCEWTNDEEQQSWIVMNPSKTKPALSWEPYSGEKYFLAMTNGQATGNDDYLVRPVTKGGGLFTFFVRAVSSSYPESFELVYSTTTSEISEFKTLPNSTIASFPNTSWARGTFTMPADARYIGIHCTSKKAFGLLVDDLSYKTEEFANPTGYELYLDGTKVKDAKADELTYTFQNLEFGEHKVGVKAVYASGKSELVEKTVKVSAEAMPVKLNVAVDERTAVLTWDIPEGFAPKSYKVFLGEELKAENLTEKTYTFSELKNGTYTAAVVAVYETGESEKASIEFIISSHVDVEDFDMAVRSSVYPNPNDGMFYLKAADKGTVEVYAMNGQLVKRVEIPARGTYSINLQNRAKGLYLMRFATRENTTLFKIVVR